MSPEDARDYAKHLTDVQRALVAGANGSSPMLIKTAAEQVKCDVSEARHAAEQLVSMNLVEIKQSRLGKWFWHSYVELNDRGIVVQTLLKKKNNAQD